MSTVREKTFIILNHAASQPGPAKNRYLICGSCVLPYVSVAQIDVRVSFAMCVQLNFLDLKRFYSSDIYTRYQSQVQRIFV